MYIHIHIMYEQGSLYASKKHTKQANENFASMKCDDLVLYVNEEHQPLVTSFGMKRMKQAFEK